MNEPSEGAVTGPKQILVIEDTLSVADLIREMLAGLGHGVEVCTTVEDALAIFAPEKYDLIITDYSMPRMNGIELAHIIRRLAPDQLVLLITGSTFSLMDDASQRHPVNAFLEKPFSMAEFSDSVMKLLLKNAERRSDAAASSKQDAPQKL
jgi:CheY-like chemotaxis protein